MDLPQPLIRGTLIRRYKRFLADIILETGEEITAHCANPGAMMGLDQEGAAVWVSVSNNPKRKLKHSFELVDLGATLVGINTAWPNRIVAEALSASRIEPLAQYETVRPEVKYGEKSRVDFLLTGANLPDCYLEVKNVHLLRTQGLAEFPDCPTARGARHLDELAEMVRQGHRAVNLFLVQREDCAKFTLAKDLDPKYAEAADRARQSGVEFLVYDCHVSTQHITLNQPLPIEWHDG